MKIEKKARAQKAKGLSVVVAPRFVGTNALARRIGCHPVHLSYILHGRRRANDDLRRKLMRLGVTKTAEGEEI